MKFKSLSKNMTTVELMVRRLEGHFPEMLEKGHIEYLRALLRRNVRQL